MLDNGEIKSLKYCKILVSLVFFYILKLHDVIFWSLFLDLFLKVVQHSWMLVYWFYGHFDLLKLESSTFFNFPHFSMKFNDVCLSLDIHISNTANYIHLKVSASSQIPK